MAEQRPPAEDFVPETNDALKRLSHALVDQLEPPHRDSWTQLEFTAKRAMLPEHGEGHRMRLTVWQPAGDFPLIPRPEAMQACAELDRISSLGQRPRWRSLRLLLQRPDGEVSFQCWWTYDSANGTEGEAGVVE